MTVSGRNGDFKLNAVAVQLYAGSRQHGRILNIEWKALSTDLISPLPFFPLQWFDKF